MSEAHLHLHEVPSLCRGLVARSSVIHLHCFLHGLCQPVLYLEKKMVSKLSSLFQAVIMWKLADVQVEPDHQSKHEKLEHNACR